MNREPLFPQVWVNQSDKDQVAPNGAVVEPGDGVALPGVTIWDLFFAAALSTGCMTGTAADRADYAMAERSKRMKEQMQ